MIFCDFSILYRKWSPPVIFLGSLKFKIDDILNDDQLNNLMEMKDVECQSTARPENFIHDRRYRTPILSEEFDGIVSYGIIAFTIVNEEELSYENDVSANFDSGRKKPTWVTTINEISSTKRIAKFLICER